jgi:DNA replication protein DnaC
MEARTMINSETMEKLRDMKLRGMAETLRSQENDPVVCELSFEERFGLLVDAEYLKRRNALLQRLVRTATLKLTSACMEGIEYDIDRHLDKDLLVRLSSCAYAAEHRDIIIMGATGVGKTYVGCALGMAACRKFMKVKYIRLPELLVDLSIARCDGTYRKLMAAYKKYSLLILDEWLLTPLDPTAALDLLEIIEARNEVASTIFVTQCAPAGWHSMIGEGRVADAILDRVLHNSYEVVMDGDSMRLKKSFKRKPVLKK